MTRYFQRGFGGVGRLALAAGAALVLTAGGAQAARITAADLAARNLEAAATPLLTVDPASALLGAGTVSVSGTAAETGDAVTVSAFAPFADTAFTLNAGGLGGNSLLGTSTLAASETGVLDLLIEGIAATGSFASITRALVTVTVTLPGDPLALAAGALPGFDPAATITVTAVNQIPLPSPLILMITALGGLAATRRR